MKSKIEGGWVRSRSTCSLNDFQGKAARFGWKWMFMRNWSAEDLRRIKEEMRLESELRGEHA